MGLCYTSRRAPGRGSRTNIALQHKRATRGAEGLARWRLTVADVEAMVQAGILDEDERVELIRGELVPMSPKGSRHEVLKVALLRRWLKLCPEDVQIAPETTFRLSADTYLEPDFGAHFESSSSANSFQRDRALGVLYSRRGERRPAPTNFLQKLGMRLPFVNFARGKQQQIVGFR